jgi:hypothetical protein
LIPEKFMAVIKAFFNMKKTGKIILNFKDGNILTIDIHEGLRL